MGLLPPSVAVLTASTSDFEAKMAAAKASMEGVGATGTTTFERLSSAGGKVLLGVAGAGAAVGAVSLKMAADFQQAVVQIVTGAGESRKNIDLISQGMLNMAASVGQTPVQLAAGLYLIESAGFHGAQGLIVLKAAAQGAATGGAQMATVANAVTTALTDYHLPASQAADVTSALIQTVADGKVHLQDLSMALGKVMPVASALGVSFQQVTGAIATMTNAGLTARFAATHLQNTLLALSAPSSVAAKALQGVGLTTQQVKDTLDGPTGLSGALALIETHVGSTFPKGSVASVEALKAIMGGTTGYSTALMLSGTNAKAFEADQKNIGGALDKNSQSVQGFNLVQKDLSFQLKQVEAGAQAAAVKIGDWLIPKVETLGHDVVEVTGWLGHHKDVLEALGIVAGTVATALVGVFAVNKIQQWTTEIGKAYTALSGFLTKLSGGGSGSAVGASGPASGASTGSEITSAGSTAAEAMGAAIRTGGTFAAEAMGTAMRGGGTVAGGELATGEATGGTVAATEEAGGVAAGGLTAAPELAGGVEAGSLTGSAEMGGAGKVMGAGAAVPLLAALAVGGVLIGKEITKAFPSGIGGGQSVQSVTKADIQSMTQAQYQGYTALGGKIDHVGPFVGTFLQSIHADQAKVADIKALQTNVAQQTTLFGAHSTQAQSARAQLLAAEMHFSGMAAKDTTVAGLHAGINDVNAAIQGDQVHLAKLHEDLANTTAKEGTLKQNQSALQDNKNVLHADLAAGFPANSAVVKGVQDKITEETGHIKDIKGIEGKITKTEDTLKLDQSLHDQLTAQATQAKALQGKIDTQTQAVNAGVIKVLPGITLAVMW